MAVFTYERKVQYYETDQMGIVHHSNYIKWFEETRLALMENIGIEYDKMEEDGILIPVLSASCEYRIAFRYGDTFKVEAFPVEFNGIKMKIGYRVFHKETGALHSVGETSHCFVDKEMKLVRMKKEYPQYYHIFEQWNAQKDAE